MKRSHVRVIATIAPLFMSAAITGCSGSAQPAVAAGGSDNPGGALSSGGNLATGGFTGTAGGNPSAGGTSVSGGGAATGGASSSEGGRGSGICPGGAYPAPSLSGTPTRIYSASGSGLFEGTVWFGSSSVLLFSNMSTGSTNPIVPSQIQRLTPPAAVDVLVADSGTNGMALDIDGSLIACSHKVQGIVKVDADLGTITTIVDTDASGKHFNSPNDLTVRMDGTVYFTDPDYQLGGSRQSETGLKGVYRVSPSRQVTLIDGTFGEPNGIALSPDETVLYVADMNANAIRQFPVQFDGSTGARANFASVTSPDGVAVDCAGNLYWASNSGGRVVVLSPSGTQLGSITVAASVTNLAFGGTDHKTLYISAGTAIYSMPMTVPGFPY